MRILGIIPARYASTRFPAKALALIKGKPMVEMVLQQCKKSVLLSDVVVATDHQEIYNTVIKAGGKAVMTKDSHPSGTDRCAEVIEKLQENFDFVINIQGDEPFIKPEQIDLLAGALEKETEIATLIKKIEDKETLFNPNTPKVIFNEEKNAIYFSRNTIPYLRNFPQEEWILKHTFYKHIGIYAYRTDILNSITKLQVGKLESAESLEQLRWLENGYKIKVCITEFDSHGIDTPEDLKKILEHQ